MLTQTITIPNYDWVVDVYYYITKLDKEQILKKLKSINATDKAIDDATSNIERNAFNSGFIYTSYDNKHSVIIINHTTEPAQFMNTFVHELNHLGSHIEEYYDLDPHGEEASKLLGNISQELYPSAKKYLHKDKK